MRFFKLILATLLTIAVCIAGTVLLISGLSDQHYLIAAGGGMILLIVIGWIGRIMMASSRQGSAQIAQRQAKRQAGMLECPKCQIDFPETGGTRTAKPWHHTAALMLVAMAPIVLGGLVFFSYLYLPAEDGAQRWNTGVKAGILILFGLALFAYAIRSSREFYIRCPKCGRVCASAPRQQRGFEVRTASREAHDRH